MYRPPQLIQHGPERFSCGTIGCVDRFFGRTAEAAYQYWAEKTRAGRFHRNMHGFHKVVIQQRTP